MARVEVTVAPSGMEATARASGEVTEAEVREALRKAGVLHGIDDEQIREMSQPGASGEFVVALGIPASPGVLPDVELLAPQGALVRKGAVLARLKGGEPPKAGRTVAGKEIPAPRPPPPALVAGEHVTVEGSDFRAAVPGYASHEGHRVAVLPLVRISEDRMSAEVVPRGPSPPEAELREMLREAGVVSGILEERLRTLPAAGGPVVVAVGQPPLPGQDASLRFAVDADTRAGTVSGNDRMDFHKQLSLPPVKAGDVLAFRIPATPGTAGSDVLGAVIPPSPGKDLPKPDAGENVQLSEDGLQYRAATEGIVYRRGHRFMVLRAFEVKADVDFSTGDIETPYDVLVRRNIRSTFAVKAKGRIVVLDSVEDAIVESGADVEVRRGVIHSRVGHLAARGDVTAGYAQNAEVRAGGSISIRDGAVQCFLTAGRRIEVLGNKGVLLGGTAAAGEAVVVRVAGSNAGVKTVLRVGANFAALEPVEKQLQIIHAEMAKILAAAGEDNVAKFGAAAQPQGPAARWRQLEIKKQLFEVKRATLLKTPIQGASASVEVGGMIFPGVELHFGNASLVIKEETPGGRYILDAATGQIIRLSL
jgi:uncharacterized protein (DUF342 family)